MGLKVEPNTTKTREPATLIVKQNTSSKHKSSKREKGNAEYRTLHNASGGTKEAQIGGVLTKTHTYIMKQALAILKNDKGFSCLNEDKYTTILLVYTDWPDRLGCETDHVTWAGHFYQATIKVSEQVEIFGLTDETRTVVVTGVEMFRKLLDQAIAGDNIGVLLRGVQRTEIERGQVLAKPGTIKPLVHFDSEVYVLTKEEGGRHTPFFNGYRPQFYFRTTDVTGVIKLPEGVEMVMPGDNIKMDISLITPIAIEKGLRFAIREGGRTVGSGVVANIFED